MRTFDGPRRQQARGRVAASWVAPVLREAGRPLDPATRDEMGGVFGHDFGAVRVHDGDPASHSARALGARAYAFGHHLVFRRGAYQPAGRGARRLLAHELAHVVQQGPSPPGRVESVAVGSGDDPLERQADAAAGEVEGGRRVATGLTPVRSPRIQMQPDPDVEDDEFRKPPVPDLATLTRIATLQVARASGSGAGSAPSGPDMMSMPSAGESRSPGQLTLEALLAQPDLRRVLHNMAKDLGYLVKLYVPGDLSSAPLEENSAPGKELRDLGVEGRLIDPVALVAAELGVWESTGEARRELIKALKGLPAKAVEGLLEALLELAEPAARPGPNAGMGAELTAVQEFPIIGSMEFEVDLSPAPEVEPRPDLRLLGGHLGNRVKQGQGLAIRFTALWPKPVKDPGMPAGERRITERWRVDVLSASGSYQVGLPGLGGWKGFSYRIPPDQETGVIRFRAPSLPGLYQARLVDSSGQRARVLFRVAGSG